ncbi:MAG: hypothetical protein MI755_04840 [Sphingomonadales bacterium]|nr:hypothetical protein [Sphingomonadales bacterium]
MNESKINIEYKIRSRTVKPEVDYRGVYSFDETLYGDFIFRVNDADFSIDNTFVLSISSGLIYSLEACLFFGEKGWTHYPEYDLQIATTYYDSSIRLELSDSSGVIQSANCEVFALCRAVGDFHKKLICESFRLYPELMSNNDFLQYFPAACLFIEEHGKDDF